LGFFLASENIKTQLRVDVGSEQTTLFVGGQLNAVTVPGLWTELHSLSGRLSGQKLCLDLQDVQFCDGAGAAFLLTAENMAAEKGLPVEIRNLNPDIHDFLERFDQARLQGVLAVKLPDTNAVAQIGKLFCDLTQDIRDQIAFFGHLLCSFVWTFLHPGRIRWNEFLKLIELVGVNAVGITALLGFLFGLIMAFSAAMPLRQFGVEVYVSDLVAIALVRVLGPFITAIIIAGRSGSAFAAELGTMKINNELDALNVMSLEPMRFLVVPRVASVILMSPLLVMLANMAGIIGSGLVILSLGYGMATYYDHVQYILDITDVLVGQCKALVFGGLVGGIGCLRGLQTQTGAGAVGISTTRAVVSGIVLIVIAEGLFSVLLHILDI
jgi:phospholipid/cholesterol/gamma-HCH transport system permease protein